MIIIDYYLLHRSVEVNSLLPLSLSLTHSQAYTFLWFVIPQAKKILFQVIFFSP